MYADSLRASSGQELNWQYLLVYPLDCIEVSGFCGLSTPLSGLRSHRIMVIIQILFGINFNKRVPVFGLRNTSGSIALQRHTITAETSFSYRAWESLTSLRGSTTTLSRYKTQTISKVLSLQRPKIPINIDQRWGQLLHNRSRCITISPYFSLPSVHL